MAMSPAARRRADGVPGLVAPGRQQLVEVARRVREVAKDDLVAGEGVGDRPRGGYLVQRSDAAPFVGPDRRAELVRPIEAVLCRRREVDRPEAHALARVRRRPEVVGGVVSQRQQRTEQRHDGDFPVRSSVPAALVSWCTEKPSWAAANDRIENTRLPSATRVALMSSVVQSTRQAWS